jgi:hypothetical protein
VIVYIERERGGGEREGGEEGREGGIGGMLMQK